MPTSAEIAVIIKYQNDDNVDDVMDVVLTGQYYYISYEEQRTANVPNASGGFGPYVRCIRDVKPTDAFMQSK